MAFLIPFRRLAGKFGAKAKSELQRLTYKQSLLNSVEGHENITQLAVNHGLLIAFTFSSEDQRADQAFRRGIIKYYSNWRTNEDTYSFGQSAGMYRALLFWLHWIYSSENTCIYM